MTSLPGWHLMVELEHSRDLLKGLGLTHPLAIWMSYDLQCARV